MFRNETVTYHCINLPRDMTIQEWYQTSLSNWAKMPGGGFSQINDVSPDIGN
jgi:hypothetical protein